MNCIFCVGVAPIHPNVHKHGKTEKGHQRYKCPNCGKTFPEHFDTIHYGRHLNVEETHIILQSHSVVPEGWGVVYSSRNTRDKSY